MSFEVAVAEMARRLRDVSRYQPSFSAVSVGDKRASRAFAEVFERDKNEFLNYVSKLDIPYQVYVNCLASHEHLRMCRYFLGIDKAPPSTKVYPELAQFFFYLLNKGVLFPDANSRFRKAYEDLVSSVALSSIQEDLKRFSEEVRDIITRRREEKLLEKAEEFLARVESKIRRMATILPEQIVRVKTAEMLQRAEDRVLKAVGRAVEKKDPEELKRLFGREAEMKTTEMRVSPRQPVMKGSEEFEKAVIERLGRGARYVPS
jgi:hypothetical protein